jgi:hypothetical protein
LPFASDVIEVAAGDRAAADHVGDRRDVITSQRSLIAAAMFSETPISLSPAARLDDLVVGGAVLDDEVGADAASA